MIIVLDDVMVFVDFVDEMVFVASTLIYDGVKHILYTCPLKCINCTSNSQRTVQFSFVTI